MCSISLLFFFFKQKTAYEMRISDWSSDVCSSDLIAAKLHGPVLGLYGGKDAGITQDSIDAMKAALAKGPDAARASKFVVYPEAPHAFHADYRPSYRPDAAQDGWKRALARSEERRVGKECGSKCRARRSPYN